jgi:hypothetical protein
VLVALGALENGLDQRWFAVRGVLVGYHGEIAFGLVEDIAELGEVEHAALAQLGVEVVVGESADSQLAAAQLAVLDEDSDSVVEQLAGYRAKSQ